jgi:hypothetical protein
MYIVSAIDRLSGIVNPWVSIHTELCSKFPCASTYFTRVGHVAYVMAVMRQICASAASPLLELGSAVTAAVALGAKSTIQTKMIKNNTSNTI